MRRSHHTGPAGHNGFTLIELVMVIAVVAVLIGLLLPAVQKVREAAARVGCANNLKQLALGFQHHHDAHQFFPGGGHGPYTPPTFLAPGAPAVGAAQAGGWGFQVLPYVEAEAVWQGGGADTIPGCQRTAVGTALPVFFCPSRRAPQVADHGPTPPGFLQNGLLPAPLRTALCDYAAADSEGTGVVRRWMPRRFADVTDGASNTLLLADKRMHLPLVGLWHDRDNEGYTAGWNHDTIRTTLYPPAPDTTTGAPPPDPPPGPGAVAGPGLFGASHPPGINAALADGSVRVLTYDIDPALFRRLGDIADGQSACLYD